MTACAPVPLPDDFLVRPIAHRTLHDVRTGRPENSRAGARAAVLAGYGIEIDVQLSADGVAIVFHDEVLNRLTPEIGRVRERTADALGAIRLTHGREGIPRLNEILRLVAGRVPLLVELKDQTGELGPSDGRLEEAVCGALAEYEGPVALMSFNPHMVERCAALAPAIPRGLVTDPFRPEDWPGVPADRLEELRRLRGLERVGASYVSHNVDDLESPVLRDLPVPILCWTVRSPEQEAEARRVARNITFEGYLPRIPESAAH